MAFFPVSAPLSKQPATPTAGGRSASPILYRITHYCYLPQGLENAWALGDAWRGPQLIRCRHGEHDPSRWRVTGVPRESTGSGKLRKRMYGEGLAPQPAFPGMWIDGWRPSAGPRVLTYLLTLCSLFPSSRLSARLSANTRTAGSARHLFRDAKGCSRGVTKSRLEGARPGRWRAEPGSGPPFP